MDAHREQLDVHVTVHLELACTRIAAGQVSNIGWLRPSNQSHNFFRFGDL